MERDRLSRKLAVILHADVVGSTLLVLKNETLAHERIQSAFHRFSETINSYGGITRELRGDALVAEFERASDAVAAALAFQASNTKFNTSLDDPIQPQMRMGISMGEVVIADNTITGAGVVLAQRLEQLAEPGKICIQGGAYETVPQRLPFEYKSIGKRQVKGFEEPVRAYTVTLKPGENIPTPEPASEVVTESHKRPKNSSLVVGSIVLLVLVGISLAWWRPWVQREEPASMDSMAYPLPDKPSIAVLPFTNMSDDPKQEYFADGMTEDLITDLSKISGLFVIARNSSFSYKGQQVKVRQVAEDLGVRYVLEGSVRRVGDQVRINAQLIDATTGGHLWAERYDGSLADIFALQDRVTTRIVDAMSVTLTPQEANSLGSAGTSNSAAHDAYLLGLSFYLRSTPVDNAKSEPHFKRAVELEPNFMRAYAALAGVYYKSVEPEYSSAIGIFYRKATFLAHINLAKVIGGNVAQAHVVRSQMALNKHQVGVALREAKRALDLSSNDAGAMKAQAIALIYSGRYVEGRKLANQAIRLDPAFLAEPLYIIGLSHFAERSYDKAADYLQRAIKIDPTTNTYHRLLVAVYGKLGMEKEAKEAMGKFRKLWRGNFWIAAAVILYPFQDGKVLKDLADGFEAAGTAIRPPSRYLKLDSETRLTGREIKTLLFGHSIRGREYGNGNAWDQKRIIDGKVLHSGISIHTGFRDIEEVGEGWIEDNRLCDRWSVGGDKITICVAVFRDMDRGPNGFYMVTDSGPHTFRVSN